METKHEPDEPRRAVGIAARGLRIVPWLAVFLLGFVAGVFFHSRYPEFSPRHTVQREEMPSALQVTKAPPPTRAEPEQLLAALANCARNLAGKERELVRQAKEDRIADSLSQLMALAGRRALRSCGRVSDRRIGQRRGDWLRILPVGWRPQRGHGLLPSPWDSLARSCHLPVLTHAYMLGPPPCPVVVHEADREGQGVPRNLEDADGIEGPLCRAEA
jgi:hypothetical protein